MFGKTENATASDSIEKLFKRDFVISICSEQTVLLVKVRLAFR